MAHPVLRSALGIFSMALLVTFASTIAQAQDRVLKGGQVTESSLIDALIVEPPAAASGLTRGFKPAPSGAAAPAKPAGPGRASLQITFNTNSADLTPESTAMLETVGKALQSDSLAGLAFRVEGHADARGDAEANRVLSQQRAEAVVAYLVNKQGILSDRLTAQGKGSSEPLNTQRVDAPENRRVTIVTIKN